MPLPTWLKARSASIVLGYLFLSLPELELDEGKAAPTPDFAVGNEFGKRAGALTNPPVVCYNGNT
jgi:hypothetical protein